MWTECESMPRAELEDLQSALLKSLVERLSAGQAFYRKAFKESGIDPEKFRGLEDLSRLPFTRKSDLRDNYPFGMLACSKDDLARFHASSGTRGKPTLVAYTRSDLDNWAELAARSLYAAGARPHDFIHNAYGYGLFTGGLGVHQGIERLGAVSIPASGGQTQVQITLLKDLKARVICCTPSYALRIAGALAEQGMQSSELGLELGIFGAEPWTEPMRSRIEEELGLKAVDIYGLSEVMGPGVSIECIHARRGLHIWEDYFIAEVIDPVSLEPLPDGSEGELVLTTLRKDAMPVLRYRTGDLSTLTREKCSCGRTMARMTRVRARIDDMLIIRGVNVYPSEIENILLQIDELAPHYQLVLKRDESLDELFVQVEITEEILARWAELEDEGLKLRELTGRIKQVLKDGLGLTVGVELMPARSIKRSEGKACRLLDLRQVNRS